MEINNNYYFPDEISVNILSRLPTVSVISCSLVCKSWRNLIVNNREFARTHLLRGLESHHGASVSNGRFNFLLLIYLGYGKGYTLYYTLDDDNYEKAIPTFRALRLNPNPYNSKNYYVVGSCNGLICMAYDNDSDYNYEACEQPIYIINPTTREWLIIPCLIINRNCDCPMYNDSKQHASNCITVVCGFGYLPSTNEYKVVRIYYYFEGESHVGRVQVYTLGDGTGWRDKGEITYYLEYFYNPPSIFANGALHWIEEENRKIVSFDLADEEFLLLPSPPCFDDDEEFRFQIQVLGGQLCAFNCKENSVVGVWLFKNEKKEKNGNYKDENGGQEFQFWSWIKEYNVQRHLKEERYLNPFILTKQGDVLYYSNKRILCFEFKTATTKELVNMVKCPSYFQRLEAIPHLNSFISLKALGEEDTKIIIESLN